MTVLPILRHTVAWKTVSSAVRAVIICDVTSTKKRSLTMPLYPSTIVFLEFLTTFVERITKFNVESTLDFQKNAAALFISTQ